MKTQEKSKTLDYLDRAKERLGITSDYALAKRLEIDQTSMSNYRMGRSRMDDSVAMKVARILELDPLEVIAAANIERAKTDETREFWKGVLEKISKGFDVLLLGASPHGA